MTLLITAQRNSSPFYLKGIPYDAKKLQACGEIGSQLEKNAKELMERCDKAYNEESPDIKVLESLTQQIIQLENELEKKEVIYSSRLNERKRQKVWRNILDGNGAKNRRFRIKLHLKRF